MPEPQEAWKELKKHLESNYYKPDLEALRIVLSVSTAHYFRQDEPVWLMCIGAPGTGKTSICIESVLSLPMTYNVDSLTPQTFLSGFQSGPGTTNSLLHQIGTKDDPSGIITMADFSSFLGLREEPRREIGGQLRKIYDGYLDRSTGVGRLEWEGKVTLIVAATAGAERLWGEMRSLGERFMQVRWPRGDGVEQALSAFKQIGRERDIKSKTARLVSELIGPAHLKPVMVGTERIEAGVAHLAEIVAVTRTPVERGRSFRREICEEPEPEGPTRIMKALAQVAMGHAAIFRRKEPLAEDYRVARRLGLDSVPPARLKIIQALRYQQNMELGWANLVRATGIPGTTVTRVCEDLEALGVVEASIDAVERSYSMKPRFARLLTKAAGILDI